MFKKGMIAAAVLVSLSGCAGGLSPVGTGLVTDVKGPITVTTLPTGAKNGTACAKTILGLVNQGDASIAQAKKAGGISTVSSVDYHTEGFYPFFGTTCVTVNGQ
ncbi:MULTISPECIES: TRL-like family protein [unclassified Zymobacter]|uniref:TRL-like family protein n=1 Tax=unclassified Zymobacter TaxID=3048685 RepID=UPI0039C08317